jgi:hypothetical protein
MADGEDALVLRNGQEPAQGDPVVDRAVSDSAVGELASAHDAGLAARQRAYDSVSFIPSTFSMHVMEKVDRVEISPPGAG